MENSADSVRKLANHVNLFSNVKYYLSGVVKEEVVKCLNDGGAEGTNYFSDFVTHCILGDNYSEGDAIDARDLYEVPAVVEDWVSLSVKCKKLLPTKPFSAIDTKLFANVTVCLSQVSYADCRNLWSLITFNGGRCDLALHDKITHLIVSKPQGSKYNFVVTNETTIKIVTPDWLVDCVRRNTICDEELYHPRLLLSSKSSSFKLEKLDRQISQRKTFKDEETNVLAENPSCDKKVSSDIITAQSSLPIEIKVDEPVAVCKVDTDVNKQMQPIRCSPVLSTQTQPSTGVTEALDTSSQLTLPQQILHIRMVQTTSALSAPKPPKSLSTISSISSDTTALSSKQSSTPSTSTQLTVVSSTSAGEPITTNVTVPSTLTQLLQNNSSIIRHQQVSSSNQNYTPTPYSTQQIPEYIKQELFGQLPQQRQKLSQQQVQQLKVSQPQVQQQKIPQQQLTQQQINQQQSQQIPPQQQQQVVQQQLTQQQQVVQQQLTQQQQVVQQQVIQQQQQLTHQQQHQITPQQKQILQQQLTQHKQVLQQQQVTQQQLAQQKQVLQQQLSQQVTQQQQLSQQVTQQHQLSQQVSQQQQQLSQQQFTQQKQGLQQHVIHQQQHQVIQQQEQQVTQQQQVTQHQQIVHQQVIQQQGTQQQQQVGQQQQVTQHQQIQQQVSQQQQQGAQQQQQVGRQQQVTQHQQLLQQPVVQQQGAQQQVTQHQQILQQQLTQQQIIQQQQQQQQVLQVPQQQQVLQQVSQQQQVLQQVSQQQQVLQQVPPQQQQQQLSQQQQILQQIPQQQQVPQQLQQQQQVPQQLQQQQQVQLQQLQQQQLRQQQLQQQIQQQLQQLQQSSQHLQSQPVQQLQQQSPQMQTQQTALTPSQLQQQQALLIQKRNLHQQRILLQQQLLQQSGGTAHWRPSNLQIVSGQAATAPTATTPDSVGSVVWQQQQQLPQQGSQHVTQSPQQQRSPHLQQVHIRGADQHSVITTWTRQIPGQSQSGDEMIQLDAKTHQQLQLMSNAERVAFVNKLKLQRQLLQQQGSAQLQQLQQRQQIIRQPLQGTQTIIRAISQQLMPPGLSQHQQIEWLQQHQTQIRQQQLLQQQQQGLSKTQTLMTVKGNIIQQVPSAQQGQIQQQTAQPNQQQILSTVIQNNASTGQTAVAIGSPQHLAQLQQQRHQQHLQRLQLLQETHKQQLQQPVVSSSPTAVPFAPQPANSSQIQSQLSPQQAAPTQHSPQQQPHQQTLVVNPKTKTALANMLSIRLQGSVTSPQHQQPSAVQMLNEQPEMSAAGQLRMMTAQHHAVQRMQPSLPPPPTTPTAQLQYHVSRTPQAQSTTVPVSRGARAVANAINVVKTQMGYNNSASRVAAALAKCAAGQAAAHNFNPQTRFFGHTPGLHVPPEKCLLGCIFLIVEYDRHAEYGSNVNKWHQVIEENGGEVETSYTLRLTHILCMTQKHPLVQQGLRDGKRCITADWLSDILLKQLVVPPYYALHLPVSFSDERPCRHFIMSLSGFKGEERARIKYMVELTGAKITSYFSSDNNFLICRRLEGKKVKKAREIGKPIVNVQWLNELLFGHFTCLQQPDNPKYQQYNLNNPFKIDYTLVIHLMAAWKTPIIIPIEMYEKAMINASPHGVKRKRSRLSTSGIMDSDQENSDASLNDVPITNPNPPAPSDRPVVLFSGFINPISEQKIVKQLGGEIGKSCRDATHLVMKQPVRTFKFLCAISVCKHIVNLNWLTDSLAHNTFLDETSYAVNDVRVSDGSLICDVKSVLQSVTRKELFQGKIFYITPGVIPAASALREIIECAGGLVEKQRRSLKSVLEMKPLTYLAITCNGDLHLVADLVQSEYGVYSAEFVLSAVMTQTVQYDSVFKKPKLSVSN